MSFQAYLDNIEEKTGLRPRQFIELAQAKGLDDPAVKAGALVDWLKEDYGLGRGHAMALVHVIKKGPQIDPSDMQWLDGKTTNPRLKRIRRSWISDQRAWAFGLGVDPDRKVISPKDASRALYIDFEAWSQVNANVNRSVSSARTSSAYAPTFQ